MPGDAAPTGQENRLPGSAPSFLPRQLGSEEIANRTLEEPEFRILALGTEE